jgi:rhodanese-related sulfurtransferase
MMSMLKLFLFFIVCISALEMQQTGEYQCTPCGNDCDKTFYDKPGECEHCHMPLVKRSTVVFKTIKPSDICGYISSHPSVVLLDVRTKEEFEGKTDDYGTIKNAINIPIQDLEKRVGELNDIKDKEIIVYCSFSKRSPRASYFLSTNGFKNVTNMEGGISAMTDKSCKK